MKKNYILLFAFILSAFAGFSQTAPPWNFDNSKENFVGSNFVTVTEAPTYVIFKNGNTSGTTSANPNFTNSAALIDTSKGGFIAVTLQNNTLNTKLQVILNRSSSANFTTIDISTQDTGFKTYYFDMTSNAAWTGTVNDFTLRCKASAVGTELSFAGEIFIDKIEIVSSNPLGVNDFSANSISILPNPVKNVLTIDSSIGISKVEVYNVLGQQKIIQSNYSNGVNVSNLSKGIYIARVYLEDNSISTKKFIKD